MRKFLFLPQELLSLTVPETFALYIQAIIDQADADNPDKGKHDHSLAPHLADEARAAVERALQEALAFDKMTPDQKLEMARRLYG